MSRLNEGRSRSDQSDETIPNYWRHSLGVKRYMPKHGVPSDQPACLVVDDGSVGSSIPEPEVGRATLRVGMLGQLLVCTAVALTGTGCTDREAPGKYVPATDAARQSLEAALDAWKRGEPPGKVQGASTAIEVADSKRQAGQTLASYEILGEVPGEGPKRFSVRLKLASPSQEIQTEYVIVGRDPIWVFGEEDYAQPKGM